ncbi:MAG: hypothetical protein KF712_15900 [Akkermansiaceae bacterium]|nr:hypothetical protein [Akkermansiaceae bacterium]
MWQSTTVDVPLRFHAKAHQASLGIEGRYVCEGSNHAGESPASTFNLFGCPVFVASSEFGQSRESKLIGVNLRGSAENLKKQFIDIVVVKALVDEHISRSGG